MSTAFGPPTQQASFCLSGMNDRFGLQTSALENLKRPIGQLPLQHPRLIQGRLSQACHSSGMVRITGMALGWIAPTS